MWIFRIPEAATCCNSEKYVHVEITIEGSVAGGNIVKTSRCTGTHGWNWSTRTSVMAKMA